MSYFIPQGGKYMKRKILMLLILLSIILSISIQLFIVATMPNILDIADSSIILISRFRILLIISSISTVVSWILAVLIYD